MSKYHYTGRSAFGEDRGTFWPSGAAGKVPLRIWTLHPREANRKMNRLPRGHPIVWYVDDERGNREWFRDRHRKHFAVVTFSSRAFFLAALKNRIPCDAVVTDIFFPSAAITTDADAHALLSIYGKIADAPVSQLSPLWADQQHRWKLDGFRVAKDVLQMKSPVPVFLYSRKAPLLLTLDDYLDDPCAVRNSHWLVEKIDPTSTAQICRKAASIQHSRIAAIVTWRNQQLKKDMPR
jgi:hypothetical protein